MKRKFISALLFGALCLTPTSTFVSCSDYDDDIENLQKQITTNAATLSELAGEKLKNVEVEVEALKSAQRDLRTPTSRPTKTPARPASLPHRPLLTKQ